MKPRFWFASLVLLLAITTASESSTITPPMSETTGSGSSRRTRGITAVLTNIRTAPGDTIVAIQRTRNYSGVLEFRGDSTWLAPGTTILTNAKVCFYDRALVGDPSDGDLRPVRVVASGLRTDESAEGGTIDRNAGVKVYGYLQAHHLEVTGFTNPPYGGLSAQKGGYAIIVQHNGWADLYDCRTYGNVGGLRVPSFGWAPAGTSISRAQTFRCSFEDSLVSLDANPDNRASYYDEYSRFARAVWVGGTEHPTIPVGPDSLEMTRVRFFGSRLSSPISASPDAFTNGTINVTKSADFDDDGKVGFVDFFMFATHFGRSGSLDIEEAACDMDGNGRVEFADFFLFASQFGRTTKPTTLALAKPVARQPTLGQIEYVGIFLGQHPEFLALLPREIGDLTAQAHNLVLPQVFSLAQNFPNPFNPVTTIGYSLAEETYVRLTIYGLTGQVVRTLVSARQAAGRYLVQWDGTDGYGHRVASGTYFAQLQAGAYRGTRQMLLLK